MATAEEYAQWIVSNADKKGTPEFDTVAKAYQQAKSVESQQGNPAEPSTVASRIGTGMMDPIHGAAQLAEETVKKISPEAVDLMREFNNFLAAKGIPGIAPIPAGGVGQMEKEREQKYAEQRAAADSTGVDWARMAGNVVSPANVALAAAGPAGGATLATKTLGGVATGAAMGALTPVSEEGDFWHEKAKQAALGGVVGAVAPAIAGGVARVIKPTGNPEAAALAAQGIRTTPGQTLGGAAKTTEEKLTSVPILGEAIKAAQRTGLEDFNRTIYRRALGNLGDDAAKVANELPVGNDGVRAVGNYLSSAYDQVLDRSVPSVVFEGGVIPRGAKRGMPATQTPFTRAIGNIDRMVPSALRDDFRTLIRSSVFDRVTPAGTLTPSVAKEAESFLGAKAANYSGSAQASERELGRALKQAQAELRDLVAQSNPEIAPIIQKINAGWADLVQIENAAGMLGAKNGVFTPSQYLNAIKRGDKSLRDRRFVRNEIQNVEFARTADNVLSTRYPDSGTTGRSLLALLLGGAAGGHYAPVETAAMIGSLGLASLPYTRAGNALTQKMLTARPQAANALAQTVRGAGQYAIPAAIAMFLGK